VIDDPSFDGQRRARPASDDDALAKRLHAEIRHGSPRRVAVIARVAALAEQVRDAIRDGDRRKPDAVERAIGIFDELARAARITTRVWSEALAASLTMRSRREPPRGMS
jgi:hypothetical protein